MCQHCISWFHHKSAQSTDQLKAVAENKLNRCFCEVLVSVYVGWSMVHLGSVETAGAWAGGRQLLQMKGREVEKHHFRSLIYVNRTILTYIYVDFISIIPAWNSPGLA